MAILLALVVEHDGRSTEVAHVEGPVITMASTIAKMIDHKEDGKKSFEDQGYIYNVLVASRTVYLCVSKTGQMKQRLLFQFLDTIRHEYDTRRYTDKEDISGFEEFIEAQMDRFSNHPEDVDKITGVQKKVDDVTKVAKQNLDKLLEREDRLEVMVESTERLKEQGSIFQRISKKQKWLERKRNIFWTIVLLICCVILIALIVGIILIIVYA
jgi:vesicle-associated membrane protein 7